MWQSLTTEPILEMLKSNNLNKKEKSAPRTLVTVTVALGGWWWSIEHIEELERIAIFYWSGLLPIVVS